MKKAGNRLMEVIGGRSVHPVNVRVGGFYRAPDARDLRGLAGELEWARQAALDTVAWVATFDFPDFSRDYEYVSLRDPAGYPIMGDRIVSSRGLDIPARDYDEHFTESQVPHSTALHSRARRRPHLPGRAAGQVQPELRAPARGRPPSAARAAGLGRHLRQPVPQHHRPRRRAGLRVRRGAAAHRATTSRPTRRPSTCRPRAATGYGCTEAPRGLLYHRYRITADGTIADAKIVPPTSQNQRVIEADLREFVGTAARPAARPADLAVRAGRAQPRPVHLLRGPLPRPARPANLAVTGEAGAGTGRRGGGWSRGCARPRRRRRPGGR